jgi:hypothetical protein
VHLETYLKKKKLKPVRHLTLNISAVNMSYDKPEFLLSLRGLDKVIYDKDFYFFGSKPGTKPITLKPKYIPELCKHVIHLKDRSVQTEKEIERGSEVRNHVMESCQVYREGDYEVALELNVFNNQCYTWLKLFRYFGNERKPCRGCVNFNNTDGRKLKEYYDKCVQEKDNSPNTV